HIYDVGEHDNRPYLALELVEGGTLADLLSTGPLPARDAAQLVAMLARAMHHAHLRGVVHRDLKPSNILISKSETESTDPRTDSACSVPKISDFGLAKLLDRDVGRTQTGSILGTPAYMAPEQAAGRVEEIGPLTDIYAPGAILFECVTGQPPFVGE